MTADPGILYRSGANADSQPRRAAEEERRRSEKRKDSDENSETVGEIRKKTGLKSSEEEKGREDS